MIIRKPGPREKGNFITRKLKLRLEPFFHF